MQTRNKNYNKDNVYKTEETKNVISNEKLTKNKDNVYKTEETKNVISNEKINQNEDNVYKIKETKNIINNSDGSSYITTHTRWYYNSNDTMSNSDIKNPVIFDKCKDIFPQNCIKNLNVSMIPQSGARHSNMFIKIQCECGRQYEGFYN